MKISTLELDQASVLTDFYNEQFSGMPYCYPVTEDEFRTGVLWHEEEDRPYEDLSEESILVVEDDGGDVAGFAHVAICRKGEEEDRIGLHPIEELLEDRIGLIRFLHYRAGARPAGQALLEAAEARLRDFGVGQIRAFSYFGYRFHRFCHAFQSDRMAHVGALLCINDYRITRGIILLELPDFEVPDPVLTDPGVTTRFDVKPGRGRLPNMEFQLFRGDQCIGQGFAQSLGDFCRSSLAQDTFYIPWFSIEGSPVGGRVSEGEQGKGFGRYMMEVLLREMRQLGYRHATTQANTGSPRPILLYTNMGYRVVDTNYQYFKDFEREIPLEVFKEVGF
ncbi:MAG: GNAT family N-acetyltransferase [Gemmatimonadetes bacterium]|nr:GNAT family N-acetyltransferase [Gemmatimonadota bacterium]MYB60141.1 GNAT family N-acetyltransferase [Gemmatimonadota bacterium]